MAGPSARTHPRGSIAAAAAASGERSGIKLIAANLNRKRREQRAKRGRNPGSRYPLSLSLLYSTGANEVILDLLLNSFTRFSRRLFIAEMDSRARACLLRFALYIYLYTFYSIVLYMCALDFALRLLV